MTFQQAHRQLNRLIPNQSYNLSVDSWRHRVGDKNKIENSFKLSVFPVGMTSGCVLYNGGSIAECLQKFKATLEPEQTVEDAEAPNAA